MTMNADYAALEAYMATFRGDTVEEVALREYAGKRYRVTAAFAEAMVIDPHGEYKYAFYPYAVGDVVVVTSVHNDGVRIKSIHCSSFVPWVIWMTFLLECEQTE